MALVSLSTTLVARTKARAAQVMQLFNDLLNGITDGTKDIKVNAITVTGLVSDLNNYSYSVTGTTGGVTISNITVPENTGFIIEVFGSGLKSAAISQFKGVWHVYRNTGVCTINKYSEDRDGGDTGGYINVVADGNDVLVKAFTNSGTWDVKGRVAIQSNNNMTIS